MSSKADAHTWEDLDAAADATVFADYLDRIRAMSNTQAYKAAALELLQPKPGAHLLDAGCGTGDDAAALARLVGHGGEVIGLDYSSAMVEAAQKRWATVEGLGFVAGDIRDLSFSDGRFHGAMADRVLQHLHAPEQAVAELVRVVRPGGRVVLCDPDWATFLIDGPDLPGMRLYLEHAQTQANSPDIGRRLFGMLRDAGLQEVVFRGHVLHFDDYAALERLGNLDAGFDAAMHSGHMTRDEVEEIKADLRRRDRAGAFFACLTIFVVAGTKPTT